MFVRAQKTHLGWQCPIHIVYVTVKEDPSRPPGSRPEPHKACLNPLCSPVTGAGGKAGITAAGKAFLIQHGLNPFLTLLPSREPQ